MRKSTALLVIFEDTDTYLCFDSWETWADYSVCYDPEYLDGYVKTYEIPYYSM